MSGPGRDRDRHAAFAFMGLIKVTHPVLLVLAALVVSAAGVRAVGLESWAGGDAAGSGKIRQAITAAVEQAGVGGLLKQPAARQAITRVARVAATHPRPLEVDRVRVQRFDPDAAVVLTAGEDGAFGRRNIDDDFNGVVDDASELGAMRSDDRCLAPTDPGYPSDWHASETRVIQRGAYVPGYDRTAGSFRLVVRFGTDADPIVWPVTVDIDRRE